MHRIAHLHLGAFEKTPVDEEPLVGVPGLAGMGQGVHMHRRHGAAGQTVVVGHQLKIAVDRLADLFQRFELAVDQDAVEDDAVGAEFFPHLRLAHPVDSGERPRCVP